MYNLPTEIDFYIFLSYFQALRQFRRMCNPPYDPKVNNSASKFITTEAATYTSPFGEENSDTRPTTRAKSRTNQRTPFVQSAPQLLPTHVRAHNMFS